MFEEICADDDIVLDGTIFVMAEILPMALSAIVELKDPVDFDEPLTIPSYSNPALKAPLTASCPDPVTIPAFNILVIFLTSPINLMASTLPNEPVEAAEPLIIPSNSKPLVKAPLICEAICAELLIVLSKSVFVRPAAEPEKDIATILPNDAVTLFC